jgi:DNA-directed RNA polymerase III subunit RPC1
MMPNTIVKEEDDTKKISQIQFGMLSEQDMMRLSHVRLVNNHYYVPGQRTPMPFGPLDPKMGISDTSLTCATCNNKLVDCAGHFGYIKLELPVFHIGYFKDILTVLQMICKSCGHILLVPEEYKTFQKRWRRDQDSLQKQALLKRTVERCKKNRKCPACQDINGAVKKLGPLKIVHEKYKLVGKNDDAAREFHSEFDDAVKLNPDIKSHVQKAQEDLNPIRVLNLFKKIPSMHVELMDMNPVYGRPERMILTTLLAPPVAIRPSVAMESANGTNEDDLSCKLSEIMFFNQNIKTSFEKGTPMPQIMDHWDQLQIACAQFINSEAPGLTSNLDTSKKTKPTRGLAQRLKGKTGRFRGNLSGKRVDFSGRTVISPDPNLGIDEVAVPQLIAKIMTYPERVTDYNKTRMQQYVINGPDTHPGANRILHKNGEETNLNFGSRERQAGQLENGDIVLRHMINGDVVLFNRQPSLHKLSIMAHKARVMPWRTLRFNECVCTPYNADFDGDEMNLHLPQTEEARAEASVLMGVVHNLITPRNGEPLVAATQDFLTSAYLLTKRDTFFDRARFTMMCAFMGDANEKVDLPPPAILKPVELWSGKQLFGVLIRPSRKSHIRVNMETPSKNYKSKATYMDPNEGCIM